MYEYCEVLLYSYLVRHIHGKKNKIPRNVKPLTVPDVENAFAFKKNVWFNFVGTSRELQRISTIKWYLFHHVIRSIDLLEGSTLRHSNVNQKI